jgi:hypothetical protein
MIVTQVSPVFPSHSLPCALDINHSSNALHVLSSRQRCHRMQHPLSHSTLSLTRHIRQIHIPTFVPSRQPSNNTMRPCANLRRQIRAVFSSNMRHQRVRACVNRTHSPLCCAEKTAVSIPWPESMRRVLVGCVATSAERKAVAYAVSEVYALQETAVAIGGIEVARAALPARMQLV